MRLSSSAGSRLALARDRTALRIIAALLVQSAALAAGSSAFADPRAPVDLVVLNARIYTELPDHTYAQGLAVQGDKIVYVGTGDGAAQFVGPGTKTLDLKGKLVLPGLIDSHIHPIEIVGFEACDLKSRPISLKALSDFVRGCIARYKIPAGEWVNVRQWNFAEGNQPDRQYPTLRTALDMASTDRPIQLLGNDGHHGAFNSMALARARNTSGSVVGLSRRTLESDFTTYAKLIGVDAYGEPSGAANESARGLLRAPSMFTVDLPEAIKVPEKVPERLNSAGITGVLDAAVTTDILPFYDKLEKSGHLTVRATLAQLYDPEEFRDSAGAVDYKRMVDAANTVRARYATNPLIRADVVKLIADGVLEGNPYAVPPTLPEVGVLRPYLQPIFGKDAHGLLTVKGYVDTASGLCWEVRRNPARYAADAVVAAFIKANGYHPDQCRVSGGLLQHERAVIMEFVKRFHLAGFNIHIHTVGDAAVRTAVDAIEAARASDGVSSQHDALAHVQLVDPADMPRIGRDHLYLACTFAWASASHDYDMSVVPFIDRVLGNSSAALHPAGGYYETSGYPFRSIMDAGATLIAGSNAPVDTRDPQPFVNIAVAVTRQIPGEPPLGPAQRISIGEAVDAYTINGARYLNRDAEIGSIEVGKSADFIVIDRDIFKLAEGGHAFDIARTQVLETWFRGARVYRRGLR